MTRLAKLNERFLAGALLDFTEFQRVLDAYGFRLARIAGSHHIYLHPNVPRPLPITRAGSKARAYQLREARDMIERHGLGLDRS